MANPTIPSGGKNREFHCATANFIWDATAAGSYDSTILVPTGAQIVSIATMCGAIAPTTGANIRVTVGGTNAMATIAFAQYDAVGEATVALQADGLTASLSGAIGLTTTGVHDAGVTKVTVCYIV
jgi:hypothetical protein